MYQKNFFFLFSNAISVENCTILNLLVTYLDFNSTDLTDEYSLLLTNEDQKLFLSYGVLTRAIVYLIRAIVCLLRVIIF